MPLNRKLTTTENPLLNGITANGDISGFYNKENERGLPTTTKLWKERLKKYHHVCLGRQARTM